MVIFPLNNYRPTSFLDFYVYVFPCLLLLAQLANPPARSKATMAGKPAFSGTTEKRILPVRQLLSQREKPLSIVNYKLEMIPYQAGCYTATKWTQQVELGKAPIIITQRSRSFFARGIHCRRVLVCSDISRGLPKEHGTRCKVLRFPAGYP
ncbi:MAG: hypothetical protein IEMM0002_0501 [bacterium]|nr:MAG: hypothetical protein IEMM0002_0501 [bacterium]